MSKRNEMDERFKSQMNAWLMIQVIGETSVNFFNSKKLAKEMGQHIETLTFGDDPVVGTLDEKHLLFTGDGYTPLEIYFQDEVWVEGEGGHMELVKDTFWKASSFR